MSTTADLFSPAVDAHAFLRQVTESTHQRLHSLPQFQAIEEAKLSLQAYSALLQALHAYHAAIIAAATCNSLLGLSSSPRRVAMLESDLTSLGTPVRATVNQFAVSSRAAAFGAVYVAEGSALGGRVIARRLDYLFGCDSAGRAFFQGDELTSRSWRQFLAALSNQCGDPALFPALQEGAEASFALFEACVNP